MSRALNAAAGGAMMGMPLSYSYSMPGLWDLAGGSRAARARWPATYQRATQRALTVREVLAYE